MSSLSLPSQKHLHQVDSRLKYHWNMNLTCLWGGPAPFDLHHNDLKCRKTAANDESTAPFVALVAGSWFRGS